MLSDAIRGTQPTPLLVVVSAPSGGGKTTLCRRLLAARPDFTYSVSCTTRKPRGNEEHGRAYFFLSEEEFERRVREGAFLEHATVHGHRYGTLRSCVLEALAAGRSVLLAIDVQGAAQIRKSIRESPAAGPLHNAFVDVFVEPPSLEVLRARLAGRNEDSNAEIARRLSNAAEEMRHAPEYMHQIVNADLESAYKDLVAVIVREQKARASG